MHGILQNTEYTEYSKTRNLQNILYLIGPGLTKKQRQRILGCFEILKIQFSYCLSHTTDLMTMWKATLRGEGSCITGI